MSDDACKVGMLSLGRAVEVRIDMESARFMVGEGRYVGVNVYDGLSAAYLSVTASELDEIIAALQRARAAIGGETK